MKIVITEAATLTKDNDIDFSVFNRFGEVVIYDFTDNEELPERIKDADVVLCNKALMTRRNLKDAINLKYIGLFATGYNNIDLEYTREKGICVCNAGSYSTEAVAQHVFALILHFYNKVGKYNEFVQNKGWNKTRLFSPFMDMTELLGKTIGIIGFGSIGKQVAKIAESFGMKVLAYSRSHKENNDGYFTTMDNLLHDSDIVTIHCPLNKESEKMCNRSFFEKMKKDALFINTSRGGVVDEDALIEALKNKSIKEAALDVISREPMEDEKLLNIDNLIITPHAAWAPVETRTKLTQIVLNNLQKWVENTPVNVIE